MIDSVESKRVRFWQLIVQSMLWTFTDCLLITILLWLGLTSSSFESPKSLAHGIHLLGSLLLGVGFGKMILVGSVSALLWTFDRSMKSIQSYSMIFGILNALFSGIHALVIGKEGVVPFFASGLTLVIIICWWMIIKRRQSSIS